MTRAGFFGSIVLAVLLVAAAKAAPITIIVGDNDGFGLGVPDNHSGSPFWPGPGSSGSNYDGRSAAETLATNGAQFTDVYGALSPGFGPNPTSVGNVIFPIPIGFDLASGTLTVDMGDFQASQFGQVAVAFNGVPQPGLFNFQDGFLNSQVRTFPLSAAAIANANSAGQFVVTINAGGSNDFIAFDYFQLDAELTPEPASLAVWTLLGIGGVGYGLRRWRKRRLAA